MFSTIYACENQGNYIGKMFKTTLNTGSPIWQQVDFAYQGRL